MDDDAENLKKVQQQNLNIDLGALQNQQIESQKLENTAYNSNNFTSGCTEPRVKQENVPKSIYGSLEAIMSQIEKQLTAGPSGFATKTTLAP